MADFENSAGELVDEIKIAGSDVVRELTVS